MRVGIPNAMEAGIAAPGSFVARSICNQRRQTGIIH
jgi:hypothetical protein